MTKSAWMGFLIVFQMLAVGCGDDNGSQARFEPPGFTCTYRRTDYMGVNGCTARQMFKYDLDIDWWTDRCERVSLVIFEIPVRLSIWRVNGPVTVCILDTTGYASQTSDLHSTHWRSTSSVGYDIHETQTASYRAQEFVPEYQEQPRPVRAHVFWTDGSDSVYETAAIPL
jgi:hypothetical protein